MKTLTLLLALILTLNAEAMTRYEADVIAAVLILEANCQGRIGMEAVAETIWNRQAKRPLLSHYEVVTRPKQYAGLKGDPEYAVSRASKYANWPVAKDIVARFARGQRTNHTKGATHFENIEAFGHNSWSTKLPLTAIIGNHRFYYER